MGCCLSIDKKIPPPPPSSSFLKSSRTPPPPPLDDEEETVKEIFSETSIPKPFLLPKIHDEPIKFPPKQALHEIQSPVKNNDVKKPNSINHIPTAVEFSEEVSEICSTLSESVSTTMFNKKPENNVRQRSPARNNLRPSSSELKREKAVGKSPGRGLNQSPGRIRFVNGREPERKSGKSPIRVRSDLRSTSPANRTGGGDGSRNGVGRSPSVRNTGKSPSRVVSDLNRSEEGGKWVDLTTTNESLENPLVSLECFIFL